MSEAKQDTAPNTAVIGIDSAIARKIAVVFGEDKKLTMHVGKEVVVSDGVTSLSFPLTDLPAELAAGSYQVDVVAEDRIEAVLLAPATIKATKTAKNANPAAKQGCSIDQFPQRALR